MLPLEQKFTECCLEFYVPDKIVRHGQLTVSCSISERECGSIVCAVEGSYRLRGRLEKSALHEPRLVVFYEVAGSYPDFYPDLYPDLYLEDGRELGVCVAVTGGEVESGVEIPFTVS